MDNQAVIQTLKEWQSAIYARQQIHFSSAHNFEKRHYLIGLPATILAAVTSATIFTKLNQDISPNTKIVVASISLLAGIFAAVQTFYSYAKRSESNKSIAAQLGQIHRQIGILILFLPTNPAELEQKVTKINEAISQITANAPTVELPRQFPPGPAGSDSGRSGGGGGSARGGPGTFQGPIIMSPPPPGLGGGTFT